MWTQNLFYCVAVNIDFVTNVHLRQKLPTRLNWLEIIKGLSRLSQAACNIPNFRDICDLLYISHFDGNIEDKEFMIFLELVKSKNHDLPYWTYPCFGLEKLSND